MHDKKCNFILCINIADEEGKCRFQICIFLFEMISLFVIGPDNFFQNILTFGTLGKRCTTWSTAPMIIGIVCTRFPFQNFFCVFFKLFLAFFKNPIYSWTSW